MTDAVEAVRRHLPLTTTEARSALEGLIPKLGTVVLTRRPDGQVTVRALSELRDAVIDAIDATVHPALLSSAMSNTADAVLAAMGGSTPVYIHVRPEEPR